MLDKFCLCILCFSVISQAIATISSPDMEITTNSQFGTLSGTRNNDLMVFKGIPYASPPIGKLRWQPPIEAEKWQGIREAKQFDNQCMQAYIYDDMRFRSKGVSEDCLYLNIWTPTLESANKLPVLVYFYGGGFIAGDGSEPRYDGASMAEQGIAVVTVNYRLGIFGLLAHPELSAASDYSGSGNYTFLDQSAALNWVANNIQHFGGDPNNITIGGESAGGISVSALMASPLSKDLIAAGIVQSGAILGPPLPALSLEQAHHQGGAALEKLVTHFALDEGNHVEQLRKIPADTLLDALMTLNIDEFSITIDGLFLPEAPAQLYQKGHFAKVPVLAGANSQEGSYTWLLSDQPASVENYRQVIRTLYPEDAEQIMALYPASSEEQVKNALQDLASDRFISYGTWNWLDVVTRKGQQPSYYYLYEHIRPARKKTEGGKGAHDDRGAVHSAEIEYALGNLDINPLYHWSEDDYRVSSIMHRQFAQFIKQHNPNSEGLPNWPQYQKGKRLVIGTKNSDIVNTELLEKRYQFHRQYYAR